MINNSTCHFFSPHQLLSSPEIQLGLYASYTSHRSRKIFFESDSIFLENATSQDWTLTVGDVSIEVHNKKQISILLQMLFSLTSIAMTTDKNTHC